VEGAVKDFEPVVRFHTFGDSSIDLNVIVRCRDYRAQFVVRHEMVKALHKRYQREGIKIPFPIRTVIMRGESAPG
jgi:small-conductance mechanosensitive channel